MRITYARSGGFAGVRRPPVELDTATLPNDEARAWEKLVAQADFFALPASIPSRGPQADRFNYTITVRQEGGAEHTVTVSEEAVPDALRPLLKRLQEAPRRSA
jgi:hypothetical protein